MKEVMVTAHNIILTVVDGKLHAVVEAVITTTEPHFRCDGSGEVERFRVPETIRFATTTPGLRRIAADFLEWADNADKAALAATAGELELYDAKAD